MQNTQNPKGHQKFILGYASGPNAFNLKHKHNNKNKKIFL